MRAAFGQRPKTRSERASEDSPLGQDRVNVRRTVPRGTWTADSALLKQRRSTLQRSPPADGGVDPFAAAGPRVPPAMRAPKQQTRAARLEKRLRCSACGSRPDARIVSDGSNASCSRPCQNSRLGVVSTSVAEAQVTRGFSRETPTSAPWPRPSAGARWRKRQLQRDRRGAAARTDVHDRSGRPGMAGSEQRLEHQPVDRLVGIGKRGQVDLLIPARTAGRERVESSSEHLVEEQPDARDARESAWLRNRAAPRRKGIRGPSVRLAAGRTIEIGAITATAAGVTPGSGRPDRASPAGPAREPLDHLAGKPRNAGELEAPGNARALPGGAADRHASAAAEIALVLEVGLDAGEIERRILRSRSDLALRDQRRQSNLRLPQRAWCRNLRPPRLTRETSPSGPVSSRSRAPSLEPLPALVVDEPTSRRPRGVRRRSALSMRSSSRCSARDVNIRYGSRQPFVVRSSIRIPM